VLSKVEWLCYFLESRSICLLFLCAVFENTYFTSFSDFKKHVFYVFWNYVSKVVKSLYEKFSHQSVEMSSYSLLRSVMTVIQFHSEQLLNILVARSRSCWLRCRRHLQVQLSEIGPRMTLFTTENKTVWLRPEPVILSMSIQASNCCRSCSRSNTRKQTSSRKVGAVSDSDNTAVKRNNKH